MSTKTILAIDYSTDWATHFKAAKLANGQNIKIEQCEWKDLHVEASSDPADKERIRCYLKRSEDPLNAGQKEDRVVSPDFVLIRNFPRTLHNVDYRNMVIGLVFAGIPSVNTCSSVLRAMDRPIVYAELLRIRERLGANNFPLINMKYHPNLMTSTQKDLFDVKFPGVVKVGSTHAGFGKMLVKDQGEYRDAESIIAMTNDYYTTEELIPNVVEEIRIQKIGDHYRAYLRRSERCVFFSHIGRQNRVTEQVLWCSGWKGNWGAIKFKDVPLEDRYKAWADEVAKCFGGLDIFAIDVLKTQDGKEYILEINDTACGLMWEHEQEDCGRIRDLVVSRMNELT